MKDTILRKFLALIAGAAVGCGLVLLVDAIGQQGFNGLPFYLLFETWGLILVYVSSALVFAIIFYFLTKPDSKIISLMRRAQEWLAHSPLTDVFLAIAGLILGLLVALLLSPLIRMIPIGWLSGLLSVAAYTLLGYFGVFLAVRRKGELRQGENPFARKESMLKGFGGKRARPKVLDTSVIIDGRIQDVARTGILEGEIVVPEFVLRELRHIADSADALKRGRGRRGLDILAAMQDGLSLPVRIDERDYPEIPEVDLKLLRLAVDLDGVVVTNDYNLNKVASVQHVPVLNINELANAVKPLVITGEELKVAVIREGKEPNQGVGYMDDGTMIVVENAKRFIGEQVDTVVTSVLQTSAGRMIFAKLK